MALKQYTIESMAYLTTGMLDSGEEDASVEAAMCKVCYKPRFNRTTVSLETNPLSYIPPGSEPFTCIYPGIFFTLFLSSHFAGVWFRGSLDRG